MYINVYIYIYTNAKRNVGAKAPSLLDNFGQLYVPMLEAIAHDLSHSDL